MKQNAEDDATRAPCERVFDQFVTAATCKSILASFQQLLDATGLRQVDHSHFSSSLRDKLKGSWKAQNLWSKLDKRASHKDYKKGQACSNIKVLIIGSGPCGLRTAIECAFLGAKTVIVEKRDRFSRNNVLHLWPYLITDLGNLGAKMFFGKFCAGAIDHISIRQLQCILLKVALLLGVEVHMNVTFEDLIEPPANQSSGVGWRCRLAPRNHPLSEYDFDVLIGADGKRNTLPGFKRKEFRGKLAIAITANFINRNTQAEARVEEISGVAFIFNQKFFTDLKESTRIDLENIVYYKDDTHYFVMTAKKASLLEKRVLRQDFSDTLSLLDKSNVDQDALKKYAEEAANFSTNYQLPSLEYAVNHYGQADVAMFDFTSMFAAENASRFIFRNGRHLLMGLVGDSLLEPFWPTGSGCARGFLGAFDAAWMIRSWALGKTPLQVLSERESVYTVLSQTTPGYLIKNHSQYSIDPNTRYPNLNLKVVHPSQVRHLYEGDGPGQLREEEEKENFVVVSAKKARKVEVCGADSSKLLQWCQGILNTGKFRGVHVTDFTRSWHSGLALCALIQSFRPEIIDCSQMLESDVASNNQLAFDVAEKELGIPPVMTGEDMAMRREPDMLTMISYLTQFYDLFKHEPTLVQVQVGARNEAKGTDTRQLKSPRGSNRRISFIKKLSNRLARSKKRKEHEANEGRALGSITFQEKDEEIKSPELPSEKKVCLPADGRSEARMKTSKGETVSVPAMADILVAKFRDLEGKPAQEPVRKMKGQLADFTTPTAGTASEICYFCQKRVYIMERLSAEGEFFHRSCLKCEHCGTGLRLTNYFCDRDVKPVKFYCSRHAVPEMRTCSPRKRALMDILKENVPDVVVTAPPKTDTDQASQEKLPRKSIPASGSSHLFVPDVTPQAKRSTLERVEFEISFDGEEESEEEQLEHNLRASLTSVAVMSEEDSDSSGSSIDPGFEYRMQDDSEVVSKVSSSSAEGNRNALADSKHGERIFGSLFRKGAASKDIGKALAPAGETKEGFKDHQPVTSPTSPGSPAIDDVFSDHKLNRLDPSLMFRKDHKTSDRNGMDESHPVRKTSHISENKIPDSEIKPDHTRKDMSAIKEKAPSQDIQISETHGVKHIDSTTSSSRVFERMRENINSEDSVREEGSKQEIPIIKKSSKKFGIADFFTKKRDSGKGVKSDEGSVGKDAEKNYLKAQVTKRTNGDKSFMKSSEEESSGKKAEKKYPNQKAQATKRTNEDKSFTKSSEEEESDSGTNKIFIEARLSPSVRRTKNALKKRRPRHVKEKRTSKNQDDKMMTSGLVTKASGKHCPNSDIFETKIPLSCQDGVHDTHTKSSTKQESKLRKDSKEQFGELLQKLKKCDSLETEESDAPHPVSTSMNDQSSKLKNSEVLSGNVQNLSHEDAGPKAEKKFRSVFMQNREQALRESKSNREEKATDLNSSFSISTPSDSESSVSSVDLEDMSHGNRPSRNNTRSVDYRLRSGEGGCGPGKVAKVGLDEPGQGKKLLGEGGYEILSDKRTEDCGSGENRRMTMKENLEQSVLSRVVADLKTKNSKREPAGSGSTPVALTRPLPLVQVQAGYQEVRPLLSSPEDKSMVVQQRPNTLSSPSKDTSQSSVQTSPVKNGLEYPFVYKSSSSGSTSSPSSKLPTATTKPGLSIDSPHKTNPLPSNLTDHSSISTASSTTNSPKTPLTPQQKTSHHLLSKLNLFSKKDPYHDDSNNTSDWLNSSSPPPKVSTSVTTKSSTDLPTKNISAASSTPSSTVTSPTSRKVTDLPYRSNSTVSSPTSSTPSSAVTSPTSRKVTDLPYRSNSTVSSPTSSTPSSGVTSPTGSNVFGNLSPSLTAFLENKAKKVDPSSSFLRKYYGLEDKTRTNTEGFEKHQELSSPSTRPVLETTSPDPTYVLSDSKKKLPHSPGVLSVQQIRDISTSDKEKAKSHIQNPKSNEILGITCMNPGFDITGEIRNKKHSIPQSPDSITFSDDQKTSSDLIPAKEGHIIDPTPGKSKKKKIKPSKTETESAEKKKKSIMSLIRLTKTKKGSKDTDQPLSPDCSPNENGPILKTKSKEKPPKKDKKTKKFKGKNVLEDGEASLALEYSKDLADCTVFHSRSSEKANKGLVDTGTTKKYLQLPSAASSEDFSDSDDSHISVSSTRKSKNEDPQARASRRMRRIYRKQRKEADQKRLRMAQEIQRQLEEVEVMQTDMEKRGIAVEKAIRENNFDDGNRSQLMNEWFTLVHEKNALLRYESELMVRAKELELEDTQGRLEMEFRDRSRRPEKQKKKGDLAAEKRILDELLDVVEQRNNLVAMLEEERLREQKEDHELKEMMAKKGFVLSPLSFDTWREQQTI